MSLRIPGALLAVASLVFGFGAWRSASGTAGNSEHLEMSQTVVLSPRRVPESLMASQRVDTLVAALNEVVADGPPNTCLTVSVDGRSVYAHNSDWSLTPASSQKLLTARLALDILGPTYTYTTRVTGQKPEEGVVEGDLVLVGGGDPLLGTEAWRDHFAEPPPVTSLETLADSVAKAGVERVNGSIVGDESRYDTMRTIPTWPDRYLDQGQLGRLSALTVNGALTSFPELATEENRTDVTLAEDPALQAAELLTTLLRERNVQIAGEPGVLRQTDPDSDSSSESIAEVTSAELTDIVAHMLSYSDNRVAELLVKELGVENGAGGTTEDGLAAMRSAVESRSLATTGLVINDGSGLDEGDRLSCELLEDVLTESGNDSTFAEGLAVSGTSGTLRKRFNDPPVKGKIKAKTGHLDAVTALSGFAESDGGSQLTFAYIANGEIVGPDMMSLQDRLAEAMVDYTGGIKLSALGPK